MERHLAGIARRITSAVECPTAKSGNDDAGDGQSGLEPRIRATRELYRLFLAWAAQRGVSRRSEQTPFEFLHVFRQELPVVETQAVLITNLYVAVRYNDRPPAEDDLRGAITAWNQLRATPQDKPATFINQTTLSSSDVHISSGITQESTLNPSIFCRYTCCSLFHHYILIYPSSILVRGLAILLY